MATMTTQHPTTERPARPRFELTERELQQYSLSRAILTSAENQEATMSRNCLELEISESMARSHRGENHGGLFVPWNISAGEFARRGPKVQTRAGLDSKTSTTGTELKFTKPGDFLEYLYNRMRVKELGATVVSGLRDNVAFPKQAGKATGAWMAENPGSDVSDSNITLGQVPELAEDLSVLDELLAAITRPGRDRRRHSRPTGPRARHGARGGPRRDRRRDRREQSRRNHAHDGRSGVRPRRRHRQRRERRL